MIPNQKPHDLPDIVARVFYQKFAELCEELLKKGVLGVVIAYTWVIEFQKRSLPHGHMLLIVHRDYKPRTPADINKIISAELPDPNDPQQERILQTILTSQIHGPCGARNRNAPCMMGTNICCKGYPK